MQTFTCPQCGHKSTYESWREHPYCPRCGYVPSPEGNKSLRGLFAALGLHLKAEALPAEQLAQMYTFLKEQNPDKIVLTRQGEALYAFGDDARTVAQVCGSHLLVDQTFEGLQEPTARIRFGGHHRYVNALSQASHEVLVADPNRWKPLTTVKSARRASLLPKQRKSARPSFTRFDCPACRYASTYDPWVESACCPRCGYTAAPRSAKTLSPFTAESAGMITLFCPQCKLQVPYNTNNPAIRCPWCGYALPPLSQKTLLGSQQFARTRDAAPETTNQTEIDWRQMAAFVVSILVWITLAVLALLVTYLIFLPTIPLLFGVGLVLLIVGLRNVKTRRGSVSIRYVTAASAHSFDVQGWQAIALGLFRTFLGLGLVLFSSLSRLVQIWTWLQRTLPWLPLAPE